MSISFYLPQVAFNSEVKYFGSYYYILEGKHDCKFLLFSFQLVETENYYTKVVIVMILKIENDLTMLPDFNLLAMASLFDIEGNDFPNFFMHIRKAIILT